MSLGVRGVWGSPRSLGCGHSCNLRGHWRRWQRWQRWPIEGSESAKNPTASRVRNSSSRRTRPPGRRCGFAKLAELAVSFRVIRGNSTRYPPRHPIGAGGVHDVRGVELSVCIHSRCEVLSPLGPRRYRGTRYLEIPGRATPFGGANRVQFEVTPVT